MAKRTRQSAGPRSGRGNANAWEQDPAGERDERQASEANPVGTDEHLGLGRRTPAELDKSQAELQGGRHRDGRH